MNGAKHFLEALVKLYAIWGDGLEKGMDDDRKRGEYVDNGVKLRAEVLDGDGLGGF